MHEGGIAASDMATGALGNRDVSKWSKSDVTEWLRSLELDRLVATFLENSGNHVVDPAGFLSLNHLQLTALMPAVNGDDLLHCTDDDFTSCLNCSVVQVGNPS